MRKNGYHTYILSNFPKSTYEKATEELSFEKETTGAIFSYQVKCIKPEAEIYKLLLDRYHLVPQECVFIDDRPENIEAAEKLGITGIQFQNQHQAKRRLFGTWCRIRQLISKDYVKKRIIVYSFLAFQ